MCERYYFTPTNSPRKRTPYDVTRDITPLPYPYPCWTGSSNGANAIKPEILSLGLRSPIERRREAPREWPQTKNGISLRTYTKSNSMSLIMSSKSD